MRTGIHWIYTVKPNKQKQSTVLNSQHNHSRYLPLIPATLLKGILSLCDMLFRNHTNDRYLQYIVVNYFKIFMTVHLYKHITYHMKHITESIISFYKKCTNVRYCKHKHFKSIGTLILWKCLQTSSRWNPKS